MNTLIKRLEQLNRKERFLLLQTAIGKDQFVLGESFRKDVEQAIGLSIPADAFFAMDYHLDWLYVALTSWLDAPGKSYEDQISINKNQEDIDLLVAFEERELTHLVLIEAKGVTGWKRGQIASKLARLQSIFAPFLSDPACRVQPHFLLTGPYESLLLTKADLAATAPDHVFPAWAFAGDTLPWVRLRPSGNWLAPQRRDADGKPCKEGKHWTLTPYKFVEEDP